MTDRQGVNQRQGMTDLRSRFNALDDVVVPDLWGEIERRARSDAPQPVPPGIQPVSARLDWRRSRPEPLSKPELTRNTHAMFTSTRVALAAVIVAVLSGTFLFGNLSAPTPSPASAPGSAATTASAPSGAGIHWDSGPVALSAAAMRIGAGDQVFTGEEGLGWTVRSDSGNAAYRTLEVEWQEAGTEQRLYLYLAADETDWWVSQLRTRDGMPDADWITYTGPFFKTPVGRSFHGDVRLTSEDGRVPGTLEFKDLTLTPRDFGGPDSVAVQMPGEQPIGSAVASVGAEDPATTPEPVASPTSTNPAQGGVFDTSDGKLLAKQVELANAAVSEGGMSVATLTVNDFLAWYEDVRLLSFSRPDRERWDAYLADGRLPPETTLEAVDFEEADGIPDRIEVRDSMAGPDGWVFGATVMEGDSLYLIDDWVSYGCTPEVDGYTPCVEEFKGPLPSMESVSWPTSVPVRIEEAQAEGVAQVPPGYPETLRVEVQVTPSNRADLARYLSVGFDPAEIESRIDEVLADQDGAWVPLERLLGSWVSTAAGSFPAEGENDVCFGIARQFFGPTLRNGGYDRSTEASAKVLKDGYCLVPDDVEPRFGDYLSVVGQHAGRFILEDPASGRWIGFSVQSGGASPYRFWWVDEDFSGAPFDRAPISEESIRERVDIWRRCRTG